jgi:selenocysteine lyase/cysteine desulfurase
VQASILDCRDFLEYLLSEMGFEFLSPRAGDPLRSGILTARHPLKESARLFAALEVANITASLRTNRAGEKWLRFSPHFYNTRSEMSRVADVLAAELRAGA